MKFSACLLLFLKGIYEGTNTEKCLSFPQKKSYLVSASHCYWFMSYSSPEFIIVLMFTEIKHKCKDLPDYRDLVLVFLQHYPISTKSCDKNWEKEERCFWFIFFNTINLKLMWLRHLKVLQGILSILKVNLRLFLDQHNLIGMKLKYNGGFLERKDYIL